MLPKLGQCGPMPFLVFFQKALFWVGKVTITHFKVNKTSGDTLSRLARFTIIIIVFPGTVWDIFVRIQSRITVLHPIPTRLCIFFSNFFQRPSYSVMETEILLKNEVCH